MEIIKDIEYGRAGDIPLLLDTYIPETPISDPMPAVMWIHGGSWKSFSKSTGSYHARYLAEHGFLTVSIDYRLSGVAPFPAAVEDCKCAVRWLRANTEKYNIDPSQIGVWGGSAGGHLAMMAGCADETVGLEGDGGWAELSSRVQAVCSSYGLNNLLESYKEIEEKRGSVLDSSREVQFLGCHPAENPDLWNAASPINHVTADDPPLLLVHGELDQTAPIIKSEQMYEAYQQVGLEVTLVRISEAGHAFKQETPNPISPSLDEIDQIILDFFIEHLVATR
ncbi:alpha/beta hydrolase fold domain-containing protein [Chloroflexota bacterium]